MTVILRSLERHGFFPPGDPPSDVDWLCGSRPENHAAAGERAGLRVGYVRGNLELLPPHHDLPSTFLRKGERTSREQRSALVL